MNGSIEGVTKKSQLVPPYVSWSTGKAGDLAGLCVAVVLSSARKGAGCDDRTGKRGGSDVKACPQLETSLGVGEKGKMGFNEDSDACLGKKWK